MGNRYRGKWDVDIMANYCTMFKRDINYEEGSARMTKEKSTFI